MHKDGGGLGVGHQGRVDLIRRKDGLAAGGLVLLAHRSPDISINRIGPGDRLSGQSGDDHGGGIGGGEGFGLHENLGVGAIIGRTGHCNIHPQSRPKQQQRMADIVAIAHIGQLEPPKLPEALA